MLNVAINNPAIEQIVQDLLQRGDYRTAEEVVAAAVGLLNEKSDDQLPAEDLAALQREVSIGIQQADRKEFVEFTAEDIIREGLAARKRSGQA